MAVHPFVHGNGTGVYVYERFLKEFIITDIAAFGEEFKVEFRFFSEIITAQ